ncbi:MAG: hypothetical protein P1U39_06100 [Legionellaceae bacterium]|nr:hypothetical protein [Legionellaceae bacterium]
MPIDTIEKELVCSHKGKPMVGLIHKQNSKIVFAPCIPQKVSLELDENGAAQSGTHMSDGTAINGKQLGDINALLEQNHVPRMAVTCTSPDDDKSSHQLLFKQKCRQTRPSEWGGFALRLNDSNKIEYAFVSGAFNSGPGKRIKGACLSQDLIDKVVQETTVLVEPAEASEAPSQAGVTTCFETPPPKRQCTNDARVGGMYSSTEVPPVQLSLEPEPNSFGTPGA